MTGVMKIMLAASLMLQVGQGAEACHDVLKADTEEPYKSCYTNAVWAKTKGINDNNPAHAWYKHYPNVTADSSIVTFQCVLWRKNHNGVPHGGLEGHNCTRPCTFSAACADPDTKAPTPAPTVNATVAPVATAPATKPPAPEVKDSKTSSGGMPVWAWVLIVLGICCGLPCLGICCSAFICYEAVAFIIDPICGKKKGPEKKKRAVKTPAAAATATTYAAPAATPVPVVTTSVPMPVYQAAPQMTHVIQAPPVYVEAPATSYASMSYAAPAPAVTYAAPASMSYAAPASISYAAPVATYAAPAEYMSYAAHPAVTYAAPTAAAYQIAAEPVTHMGAFEAIDTNHDGFISQQEFGAAMR